MYKENNSSEMKTVVETFVIEETESLIYDNEKLQQWNDHVTALGLVGQAKVVKPDKSPIPFLCLNTSMIAVFNELCSRHVDVKEYDRTPIPVEILNLVALSCRENYFNGIEVWFDEKTPDPAIIGLTGHWYEVTWYDNSNKDLKDRNFNSKEECVVAGAKHPNFNITGHYLIGKWADVKQSFEELKARATKRFIATRGVQIRKEIKDKQRELDDLEQDAFAKFGAEVTQKEDIF